MRAGRGLSRESAVRELVTGRPRGLPTCATWVCLSIPSRGSSGHYAVACSTSPVRRPARRSSACWSTVCSSTRAFASPKARRCARSQRRTARHGVLTERRAIEARATLVAGRRGVALGADDEPAGGNGRRHGHGFPRGGTAGRPRVHAVPPHGAGRTACYSARRCAVRAPCWWTPRAAASRTSWRRATSCPRRRRARDGAARPAPHRSRPLPDAHGRARTEGFDPALEPIPSLRRPTTRWAASSPTSGPHEVAGLYAAGECACTGVHGANRRRRTRCSSASSSAAAPPSRRPPDDPNRTCQGDSPRDSHFFPRLRRAPRGDVEDAGLVRDGAGLRRLAESPHLLAR